MQKIRKVRQQKGDPNNKNSQETDHIENKYDQTRWSEKDNEDFDTFYQKQYTQTAS